MCFLPPNGFVFQLRPGVAAALRWRLTPSGPPLQPVPLPLAANACHVAPAKHTLGEKGSRLANPRIVTYLPQLGGNASMSLDSDPTDAIRTKAAAFPSVAPGTSCNQSAFKVGKRAFLYIGPGTKGRGFKAMFKLDHSMLMARELATTHPDRFEVGSTGWVTTRFTAEEPLPEAVWQN